MDGRRQEIQNRHCKEKRKTEKKREIKGNLKTQGAKSSSNNEGQESSTNCFACFLFSQCGGGWKGVGRGGWITVGGIIADTADSEV